ncbi:MAG: DinB family protein [Cyclobacteriaceae bacterium]|nr:DinB family protein [Cyclobacteriaceae bacterium]
MQEIKNLSNLIQRVYDGKAWHGPSVKDVLKDIDATTCRKKVGDSHSIVQLVQHMVSWRTFVTNRLLGNTTFELSDDQNFPPETDWPTALQQLEESQVALLNAIETISSEKLWEEVANRKYDFFVLLHGIIHHDIYHIGQIQLIKKYR